MNAKESIVGALYAHRLTWNPYQQGALDKVIAFAHGPKLGRLLWRWKYGLEDGLGSSILAYTLRKAGRRMGIAKYGKDRPKLILACQTALAEWYFDSCQVCKGAAELVINNRRVTCKYCQGLAVQRWSRRRRAQALGSESLPLWEKRLAEIHLILGAADAAVSIEAGQMLKREVPQSVGM